MFDFSFFVLKHLREGLDLFLKHNIDCFMYLVGTRTQISVSYASAFLVPYWQLMYLCVYAGPVAWIMWFLFVDLTILKGSLDSFSFRLPQCWGLPVKQLGVFPHLLLV